MDASGHAAIVAVAPKRCISASASSGSRATARPSVRTSRSCRTAGPIRRRRRRWPAEDASDRPRTDTRDRPQRSVAGPRAQPRMRGSRQPAKRPGFPSTPSRSNSSSRRARSRRSRRMTGQRLPGRTFIRGFARNYARFVRIDPDALVALMPAADTVPALERPTLAGSGRPMGEIPIERVAKLLRRAGWFPCCWSESSPRSPISACRGRRFVCGRCVVDRHRQAKLRRRPRCCRRRQRRPGPGTATSTLPNPVATPARCPGTPATNAVAPPPVSADSVRRSAGGECGPGTESAGQGMRRGAPTRRASSWCSRARHGPRSRTPRAASCCR